MTVRIDTDIPLSSPTAPPGPVGDADSPLALAGQARAHPYVVEGERVVVRGSERDGTADVDVDGIRAVAALHADVGMGVNVVVSPALVRRECVGAGGTVLESVLALPTLPMAAVQWSRGVGREISFAVLPDEPDLTYHVRDRTLRAEPADAGSGVEVLIHPAPDDWTVVEGRHGGIQVHARISTAEPVTLLAAAGSRAVTARALDAGRHLAAHALRSATDQDPANADRLVVRTGVAELDQGVGWATLRLAGALRRGEPQGPADWFWAGVGALASGDAQGALLAADPVRDAPFLSLHGRVQVPGPALSVFLTARAGLLSGRETALRDALSVLTPAALDATRAASDPAAWAWWALALDTLADALRYAASEPEVRALREAAGRSAGQTPRALPMVGEGPHPGSAPWLRALLRGEGLAGGRTQQGGDSAAEVAGWSALASGDPDVGYAAWRTALRQGLVGEAGARGAWAPPGQGAAAVLAPLAFGLLGLEPDAPSGRIRIAPALPAHLKKFRVDGIRVGDARMTLAYQRDGPTHRFRLDATDGRVPPMVVLEPSLPFTALGDARVDGAPAELTAEPDAATPGRVRVRVQISMDGPRLLEVREA